MLVGKRDEGRVKGNPVDKRLSAVDGIEGPNLSRRTGTVARLLTDDGIALLHSISRMDPPGTTSAWLRKYIFPGGMLPSPSRLTNQFQAAGLTPFADDGFGDHYARTLAIWRRKFLESWPSILDSGFDERFRRMWEYYLTYTAAGFRANCTDVGQFHLSK